MRLSTALFVVACISVGFLAVGSMTDAQAQWTEAKIPDEQHRTAQGCAGEARNPGDWVCILVRCDQPGALPSLHFSTPGADILGDIKLVIDNNSFALSVPESPKSPLAWSTRAKAVPADLLEAMKAGSTLSIEGSDLKPPYNRISLQNSRQAIERIEWVCAGPQLNAASILRRIRRSFF
jgi:hypothetical protein